MTTTYSTDSDIEAIFGAVNTTSWSDMDNDNDATKIANRKDRARVVAKARIDDVLRDTHYTVPVANQAGTTPVGIVELEARLAGIWLYENRGVIDFHPQSGSPYHRLSFVRRETKAALEEIRTGRRKLDAI